MEQLAYKIRKGVSVYQVPKVYFCCHRDDFALFFEELSEEILNKQNCSIWHHGNRPVRYSDEFFGDLLMMQLFVVPVTRRFLTEGHPALEREFRFAVEHHIPILPLMQECGLETEFNRVCGNLQYLDKYQQDSTSIRYDEKLEKFLSSVLLGDVLTEKVRKAFEAYIFLSYRKKDRKHAQELMRLVHENEFCRDIAIWYDEFLTPGEDFNQAISEAMDRCKLFLMAVTPNLINEPNYVMSIEFPEARRRDKPILPCEMEPTDTRILSEKYKNIPPCANGRNGEVLGQCLRRYFGEIANRERDGSPEHLFFIGLAYLNGIDVEVNRQYALQLITAAAKQDLPEAVEQLVHMYEKGIGVPLDRYKTLPWREKLLEIHLRAYRREPDHMGALAILGAYIHLAEEEYIQNLFDEAIGHLNAMKEFYSSIFWDIVCNQLEAFNLKRHMALGDSLLGQIYQGMNRFDLSWQHYEQAMETLETMIEQMEHEYLLREMAVVHTNMAQLLKVKGEYASAVRHLETALAIQQSNAQNSMEEVHWVDQVFTRVRLSEMRIMCSDFEEAKQCCMGALEILGEAIRDDGGPGHLGLQMMVLLTLAETHRAAADWTGILDIFAKVEALEQEYTRRTGTEMYDVRCKRLIKTQMIRFELGDYAAAAADGEQALALLEQSGLAQGQHLATGGSEAATMYLNLGRAYYLLGEPAQKVCPYLMRAVELADQYMQRGILVNIPDLIFIYSISADILQGYGQGSLTKAYIDKAIQVLEQHPPGDHDLRYAAGVYTLYFAQISLYQAEGRPAEAVAAYQEAERWHQKCMDLLPESDTLHRDKARMLIMLASCYEELKDAREKECYLKSMECYDRVSPDHFILLDWNLMGIAAYQLSTMTILAGRKWRKRLKQVVAEMKTRYPTEYRKTFLYEALWETGIFD